MSKTDELALEFGREAVRIVFLMNAGCATVLYFFGGQISELNPAIGTFGGGCGLASAAWFSGYLWMKRRTRDRKRPNGRNRRLMRIYLLLAYAYLVSGVIALVIGCLLALQALAPSLSSSDQAILSSRSTEIKLKD